MTQTIDDELARLVRIMRKFERDAAEWKAVAERARADAMERQVAELKKAAQAVIDSAARELNYSEDVLLVSTAALRALGRCVSAEAQEAAPACPRCSRLLNNLSPGISVVAGGVSVCTSCLAPGETEVARARAL